MKKNIARFFVVILVVVLALSSVGAAFAMPTCQFTSASGYTGDAPFTVTLTAPYVNSGNYNWHFGDVLGGATDRTVTHTYYGAGRYTISLVVIDNEHHYRGCSTEVNVTLGQGSVTPVPQVVPTQNIVPTQTTSSGSGIALGQTTGNNSPVVNGNGNIVMVIPQKESVPVVQQPQPLEITINVQPAPVVTQKTNWFTAFIHAFLKANEVFLHTLDESWFVPVLVK